MDCQQYCELLSARLDGELTGEEERELEAHLKQCPRCRALAEQLSGLHGDFSALEEVQAPQGFAQGVMDRIRAGEQKKVIPLFRRPQFKAVASLAACLVLCAGLYGAGQLNLAGQTGGTDGAVTRQTGGSGSTQPLETEGAVSGSQTGADQYGYSMASALPEDEAQGELSPRTADLQTAPEEEQTGQTGAFEETQTFQVTLSAGAEAPSAVILGSVQSLTDFLSAFPGDDLSLVTEAYGEDYFKSGRLLAVLVEAEGGDQFVLSQVTDERVFLTRQQSQTGAEDGSVWLILAQVGMELEDGAKLDVVIEPQ